VTSARLGHRDIHVRSPASVVNAGDRAHEAIVLVR
jgi:hypothetical protein